MSYVSADSIPNVTEPFSYDDQIMAEPCNATAASPFEKVFLPTLYSLVFIVGFAGVSANAYFKPYTIFWIN